MARIRHIAAAFAAFAAGLFMLSAMAADGPAVGLRLERSTPALTASLRSNETIYLAIAYDSGSPLRLQARAYKQGASVDQGQRMNPSVLHPAGRGKALVWVGFNEPAKIDEIRVTAFDDGWRELKVLSLPASLVWLGKGVAVGEPPAWVDSLRAEERQRAVPEPEPGGSRLASLMSMLLGLAAMASVPAYPVLQVIALRRLPGRWRWAAGAPLLVMVPAAVQAGLAFSQSSNLWPILLILAAPLAVLYLSGVFLARRYVEA